MDDEIRPEVPDRRRQSGRVEDVAQDRGDAGGAQSVDLPRRPGHPGDDMSLRQHERE